MQLSILAKAIQAELHGDSNCEITGVASILSAKLGDLTFLMDGVYRRHLPNTKASAVVLKAENLMQCPCNALVTDYPRLAFAKLISFFKKPPKIDIGIHPNVVIGQGCHISDSASIASGCVIGNEVTIGAHAVIGANTVIADRVQIGSNFYCYPNVSLYHDIKIADRVILHSGVVIGSDGFGLTKHEGRWIKIPQIGGVSLDDDVEVGANTTIDRGALDDTVIEAEVKLDNQVQIAHNVRIGAHTVIAGCVGVAGSAHIGRHCIIGGGCCISDHVTIADQVTITGMAMVTCSIKTSGIYSSGTGLQANREWRKSAVRFRQLDQFAKRLQNLERLCHE